MERRDLLRSFRHVLNTNEGVLLMQELKSAWDTANPLDSCASTMAFNVGLQQAYRQLEAWQQGDGLDG